MESVMSKDACKEIYNLAVQFYNQEKYDEAIPLFSLLEETDYYLSSCIMLSNIYLIVDNFQKAREVLEKIPSSLKNTANLAQMAYLEECEMNFSKALLNYQQLEQETKEVDRSIYETIHIKKSMGELESAKNLIELLLDSPKYKEKIVQELVGITLLEKNMDLLSMLSNEHIEYLDQQRIIKFLELAFHSEKKTVQNPLQKIYMFERYFSNSDESLYQHLEKHMEGNNKGQYFFRYINMPFLVEEAKEKMEQVNPLFFGFSYQYILQMEGIVGMVSGIPTKNLIACTFAGSSNIITMYPILLSQQFNQEGYLENKVVLSKRKEWMK